MHDPKSWNCIISKMMRDRETMSTKVEQEVAYNHRIPSQIRTPIGKILIKQKYLHKDISGAR